MSVAYILLRLQFPEVALKPNCMDMLSPLDSLAILPYPYQGCTSLPRNERQYGAHTVVLLNAVELNVAAGDQADFV